MMVPILLVSERILHTPIVYLPTYHIRAPYTILFLVEQGGKTD